MTYRTKNIQKGVIEPHRRYYDRLVIGVPSSEDIRKLIFMNYKEILEDFQKRKMKTKKGAKISHTDLRYAIQVMNEKHSSCRWQSEKIKKRYYYIQYEGVIWLREVYFSGYESKLIDKDVVWFRNRIQWYQQQFDKNNIEYPKFELKINDMTKKELSIYLNKSVITIENGLRDYEKATGENIRKYEDGELKISESAIEWLIKNKYKNKYLQLLEDYKMQLTEIYKKNGGYYDNFLGRN